MGSVKASEGKYIYGIIRHSGDLDLGSIGIGDRKDRVYGVRHREICAVVSNTPVMQYQTRRVHLKAHQLVLEEVMKHSPVLPARFSTIADTDNDSGIQTILKRDYEQFITVLDKLKNKKELGLKVIAVDKVIYNHILKEYDDIRLLKEKLKHAPPEQAHYQLLEIGRMVEKALEKEKERFKGQILQVLQPLASEVKVNDNYGERMVLNAAFLVENDTEAAFDEAVNELGEQLESLLIFKYVGTLPPYNFVNMTIDID